MNEVMTLPNTLSTSTGTRTTPALSNLLSHNQGARKFHRGESYDAWI
jgi:hypothetical protein